MNGNAMFQIGSLHVGGRSHIAIKKNIQKTSHTLKKDSIGPGGVHSGQGGTGYPSSIVVLACQDVRDASGVL